MFKRLLPKRLRRWPVALAWLAAVAVSSWVAADIVMQLTAPERVSAFFRPAVDPHLAVQQIAGRGPMAVAAGSALAKAEAPAENRSFLLLGVATGFGDDPGFAILKAHNADPIPAAEGDEIAPGVKLGRILADRVELEHDGRTETVRLETVRPTGAAAPTPIRPEPIRPAQQNNQRSPS